MCEFQIQIALLYRYGSFDSSSIAKLDDIIDASMPSISEIY